MQGGEDISVDKIEMDKGEEYVEFFVMNEYNDGCWIYLSKMETIRLAESIKGSI